MNTNRRTVSEFFADMNRFEEMRKKRIEDQKRFIEQKEVEECKRSVSRSRHDLSQSRLGLSSARGPQIPIHERLFSQQIKKQKRSPKEGDSKTLDRSFTSVHKPTTSHQEITRKLYEDAKKRQEQTSLSGSRQDPKYKTSEKSNQVYAGRILKQIERAFTDLDLLSLQSFSYKHFVDVLCYLGYCGDELFNKEKLLKDAWTFIGGSDTRNISRRSLIIFVNALNNVFLPWMSETQDSTLTTSKGQPPYAEFYLRDEHDSAAVHNKFFAFWEYRSKIRTVSVSLMAARDQSQRALRSSRDFDQNRMSFHPQINDKSQKLAQNHLG